MLSGEFILIFSDSIDGSKRGEGSNEQWGHCTENWRNEWERQEEHKTKIKKEKRGHEW